MKPWCLFAAIGLLPLSDAGDFLDSAPAPVTVDGDGGSVSVGVDTSTEVGGGGSSSDEGWTDSGDYADPIAWTPPPRRDDDGNTLKYPPRGPADPATGAPAGGGAQQPTLPSVITSSQVQLFAPASTAFALEPNGWGIVGGHVNAYASATTQTSQASILNVPVTVTFVPVEYRWDWGDGTTLTTEHGGSSWAEQGLADWSPTATSHVYSEKGQRTVSMSVAYRATVQAQGRTIPVSGLVIGQAATGSMLVVESDRALVASNCLEDPQAPGC